jgi:hypothetical protein
VTPLRAVMRFASEPQAYIKRSSSRGHPATEVYPSERPETLIREDESFSHRVRTVGRIVIERTLLVGPVDVQTGKVYYPNSPAMIANGLEAPLYDHAEARADPPTKAAGTRTYFETAPPTPDLLPTKPSPRSATDSFEESPTPCSRACRGR